MTHLTFGQHVLASILPQDVYIPGQQIDKKSISDILQKVAEKYPERYREISYQLLQFGRDAGISTGGASFGVEHLRTPSQMKQRREKLKKEIVSLLESGGDVDSKIVSRLGNEMDTHVKDTEAAANEEGNPLALQIKGAGRGNPASLARLISGDLMYNDSLGNAIPVPVLRSYSEGLTPGEFLASTFGARKGITETKLSVADSGFLAKTLGAAAHRLSVSAEDAPEELQPLASTKALPAAVDDKDNIGSLLAADFGPYKRNTIITPKIALDLQKIGYDEILVRSPLTTVEPNGGVYAKDVGIREAGKLPPVGSIPGLLASSALSEPLTQGALGSKHSGGSGKAKQGVSGFELLEKLVNPPKEFVEFATTATEDGRVGRVVPAPQGGHYVYVGETPHYVIPSAEITVKQGDVIEAGDTLSSGPLNPRLIVKYKGLGEGSRLLTNQFTKEMRRGGMTVHRRNVELVMRGLLDRVRVSGEYDEYAPDDLVPYSAIESKWTPRSDYKMTSVDTAKNKYLEMPMLHYTIGTRITPSVTAKLKKFGINQVPVHDRPPPFDYEVVRAVDLMHSDQDWMARNIGTSLDKGLLTAVHKGLESDTASSSFVPARAQAVGFGTQTFKLDLPKDAL